MTRSKGKLVALALAVVGIFTLGAAGFTCRGWVEEEYYIWKLKSKDPWERKAAAEMLGDMQSVRAVPALLATWVRDGETVFPPNSSIFSFSGGPWYSLDAIGKIGMAALPALSEAFDRRGPWTGAVDRVLMLISASVGLHGSVEALLLQVEKDSIPGSALHRAATELLPKIIAYDEEPMLRDGPPSLQ